jgi:ureidoacrylate peracid hydrolase
LDLLTTLDAQVDPRHSALVVIDVQRDFCSSDGVMARTFGLDLTSIQAAVPRLNALVEEARQHGVPVVWVREVFAPERMLPNQRVIHGDGDDVLLIRSDSRGIDWYERLTPPRTGEPVFTKWNYDAFDSTDLELWLRTRGIRTTVFVGFTTNVCVETTARHAYIRGFHVVVAGDCTGAPSQSEHEAALVNIRNYFGRVAPSSEIAAAWVAARAPLAAR